MEKIIRVTGKGKKGIKPDTIEVALGIDACEKDYAKSLKIVDDKIIAVKNELKKLGIDEIKTEDFSVHQNVKRVYKKDNNYEDKFEGYVTRHSLKASFKFDTALLGKVIDCISKTIAQPRLNISFTVKNSDEVKPVLLKEAVSNARADAEALAAAAGVRLGQILSINHSFGEVRFSYPRQAEFMAKSCSCDEECGASLNALEVEDIMFEANVTIEWEID